MDEGSQTVGPGGAELALADALGRLRQLERRGLLAPELRPMATALARATARAMRARDEAALAEVLAEAGSLVWLAESTPQAAPPAEEEPAAGASSATPALVEAPDESAGLPDQASSRAVALGRLRRLKAEGR